MNNKIYLRYDKSQLQYMKKNNKVYNCTFKQKAVLLSYQRGSITQIEKELEISNSLLNRWRKDYQKYGTGSFPGSGYLKCTPEQKTIYELEEKIKASDLKFEILKKGYSCLFQGKFKIFQFIQNQEKVYSIRKMCSVLGVSTRSYHRWKNPSLSETQKKKILIKEEINDIFFCFKQRYGYQRVAIELRNRGYQISSMTVGRYMRESGLYCIIKKT